MPYLGPFAKCKRTYTTTGTKISRCEKCNIGRAFCDWNYCPRCGFAFIVTAGTPQNVDTIDAFDLTERMNEALFHYHLNDVVTLYFPNKDRNQPREMDMDIGYQQMDHHTISDDRRWFQLHFKDEIAILKREYSGNVEIAWGFVRIPI